MSETDPNLSPLADRLPADAYYCLVHTLHGILPTPPNTSPQHLARRDNALIARLATLRPANPIEAEVAADYIVAAEHSRECLRIALAPETSPQWAMKCRAQSDAMRRAAYGALARLERMQKERRKLEKDAEASDRETWTEHCVIGLITQAFADQPQPEDPLDEVQPIDEPEAVTSGQQKHPVYRAWATQIRRLEQSFDRLSSDGTVVNEPNDILTAECCRQSAGPPPG